MRFALVIALTLTACVAQKVAPEAPVVETTSVAPVDFAYDSLDARPVTSAALRGRYVVMTFITTGNIASQAQLNFLLAMAKHDGDRVHYVLVAMEPKANRELIEIYRSKLGVTFPTAIADQETVDGRGAFGVIDAVPTTVVLDRRGRLVWRHLGIAKADEIRAQMR